MLVVVSGINESSSVHIIELHFGATGYYLPYGATLYLLLHDK